MRGRQRLASVGMLVGFVEHPQVMLGAVLSPVDPPGGLIKMELILGGVATQPVTPHVHRFGLMRHNCVVSDAGGGGVASLKERKWVRPMNFNE